MSAEAARRAIEIFFEGFNDEDDARIHEALNFPHVRIASGTVRVIEGPEHFKTPFDDLKRSSTKVRARCTSTSPSPVSTKTEPRTPPTRPCGW
jgi:hypothetical protein